MDDDQQFCLRWNNHQSTLISVFDTLLENGTLVDCTLAAEGKFLKAHKVVLCACSPYFANLLSQQYDKHPIFILKDVKFQELRAMMDYMYRGEVNISQDQLAALLKAAESLQIKGLSDNRTGSSTQKTVDTVQKQPIPVPAANASKPGYTIEHKRPLKVVATESELSGSREGSTSPSARKRKKLRRRSIETNNLGDNHDQLSNSSSQSMAHQSQGTANATIALPQITSATSAANVLNVTKKTDIHDTKSDERVQHDDDDEDDDDDEPAPQRLKTHNMDGTAKDKNLESELLIEPKSEYEDGNDETVEDLTMDDEELLEDLEQAGPSHGGEGSSQGYAQWQVDRSQDEVFLAAQEAGQHRDAQEKVTCTPAVFFDGNSLQGERFFCQVCGKNYLRKRHLQRHMRDECIGIPPRFECEFCPSKFRRKYHLVRHLNARHNMSGVEVKSESPVPGTSASDVDYERGLDLSANAANNFSVEAIMMKKENFDNLGLEGLKMFDEIQKKLGFKVSPEMFRQMKTLNL